MTFELDTLIAIAFFVPVAFFAVLNIVAFIAIQPIIGRLAACDGRDTPPLVMERLPSCCPTSTHLDWLVQRDERRNGYHCHGQRRCFRKFRRKRDRGSLEDCFHTSQPNTSDSAHATRPPISAQLNSSQTNATPSIQ